MPHLSPMNWTAMILFMWMLLSMLASINWWKQTSSWPTINNILTTKKSANWMW